MIRPSRDEPPNTNVCQIPCQSLICVCHDSLVYNAHLVLMGCLSLHALKSHKFLELLCCRPTVTATFFLAQFWKFSEGFHHTNHMLPGTRLPQLWRRTSVTCHVLVSGLGTCDSVVQVTLSGPFILRVDLNLSKTK